MRSPLAKARDKFMQSGEGKQLLDKYILYRDSYAQFLQNRIEIAFMAGAEAQRKISKENHECQAQ